MNVNWTLFGASLLGAFLSASTAIAVQTGTISFSDLTGPMAIAAAVIAAWALHHTTDKQIAANKTETNRQIAARATELEAEADAERQALAILIGSEFVHNGAGLVTLVNAYDRLDEPNAILPLLALYQPKRIDHIYPRLGTLGPDACRMAAHVIRAVEADYGTAFQSYFDVRRLALDGNLETLLTIRDHIASTVDTIDEAIAGLSRVANQQISLTLLKDSINHPSFPHPSTPPSDASES